MSIEEESRLWKELAEIIIKNSQREIEEWLKENGRYEDYMKGEWKDECC